MDNTFENIYTTYSDMVYRLCLRYCRETETVQDLVQEIFLKVYKKMDQFNQQSSPGTWLHRVAVNHCIDYYRKNSRSKEDSVDYLDELFVDKTHESSNSSNAKLVMEKVFDGVDSETKEIVLLAFVEGLTHEEIAESLGKSRSAITKRIQKFQKNIQKSKIGLSVTLLVFRFTIIISIFYCICSHSVVLYRLIEVSHV